MWQGIISYRKVINSLALKKQQKTTTHTFPAVFQLQPITYPLTQASTCHHSERFSLLKRITPFDFFFKAKLLNQFDWREKNYNFMRKADQSGIFWRADIG